MAKFGRAHRAVVLGAGAVLVVLGLGSLAAAQEFYPPSTTPTTRRVVTTTTTTVPEEPPAAAVVPTTRIEVKGRQAIERPKPEPEPSDEVEPAHFLDVIPTASQISLESAAPNLGFAFLFMFLTALPASIFNATFQSNHDALTRSLAPIRSRLTRAQEALAGVPSVVLLGGFSLLGALVYAQLEPDFGLDRSSIVLWLALALSIFLVTSILEYPRRWVLRRRTGSTAHLRTLPLSIVVAAVLVIVSRIAGVNPGYVFGIVAGLMVGSQVADEDDGAGLAAGYAVVLVAAAVAWLAWIPVHDELGGGPGSFGLVFADTFLSTFWIIALETALFSLIPMRFLYGQKVFAWNRLVWFALEGSAAFGFFMLVLNPDATTGVEDGTNVTTALVAFLAFLGVALAFWAWFRFVHPRRTVARDAERREILT